MPRPTCPSPRQCGAEEGASRPARHGLERALAAALPPSSSARRSSPGPRPPPPSAQVCPPAIGCPPTALTPSLPAPAASRPHSPPGLPLPAPGRPLLAHLPPDSHPVRRRTKGGAVPAPRHSHSRPPTPGPSWAASDPAHSRRSPGSARSARGQLGGATTGSLPSAQPMLRMPREKETPGRWRERGQTDGPMGRPAGRPGPGASRFPARGSEVLPACPSPRCPRSHGQLPRAHRPCSADSRWRPHLTSRHPRWTQVPSQRRLARGRLEGWNLPFFCAACLGWDREGRCWERGPEATGDCPTHPATPGRAAAPGSYCVAQSLGSLRSLPPLCLRPNSYLSAIILCLWAPGQPPQGTLAGPSPNEPQYPDTMDPEQGLAEWLCALGAA